MSVSGATEASGQATPSQAGVGRYLAVMLIALALPLAAVAAFNIAIDPLLFGWPRATSQPEPAFLPYDREVHYNLVAHARPRALLLGNSQTQHGIVPAHWQAGSINASVVGGDIAEMRRVLETAQAHGKVDRILLGVDFTMALARPEKPSTNEGFVIASDGGWRIQNLPSLISWAVLKSSINAIRRERGGHFYFAPDGQALDQLYVESTARTDTLGAVASNLRKYRSNLAQPGNDFVAQLRGLRDSACKGGARLQVYTSPLHAIFIDQVAAHGRIGAWEQWKRDMVTVAGERPDCAFELWDFNRFSPVTAEALPAAGDRTGLAGWWDGIHFRTATGDRILRRLAGDTGDDDFGVRLTPANIDDELMRDRMTGARYYAQTPAMLRAAQVEAMPAR